MTPQTVSLRSSNFITIGFSHHPAHRIVKTRVKSCAHFHKYGPHWNSREPRWQFTVSHPSSYLQRPRPTGDGVVMVVVRRRWLADGMPMRSGDGVYPMGSAPHGIHTIAPPCRHSNPKPEVPGSAGTGTGRWVASLSNKWTVRGFGSHSAYPVLAREQCYPCRPYA